ncbi:MAG: FAD-binding monooxygenase [Caldilinea sp. CFX5]|nr:FAD-binding monooxygenase [Caldilinea sp. CFX5]
MRTQTIQPTHAIVIGGSMAGLLTARVLSNHFTQVTLLERDKINDQPEARKGQPQTRHLHGLLAKGLETMLTYFPTLVNDLIAGGAFVTDMGLGMRWHAFGGYRKQFKSGMIGALMSRPFLEWQIRRQVVALPNVQVIDECDVEGLAFSADQSRITGVTISRRNSNQEKATLTAHLVVDASGRGSASPKWLAAAGYAKPTESFVKANVGYATRLYCRRLGDLEGADLLMIASDPPHGKRTGLIFPIEGDRWICTLGGWAGDHPPLEEEAFMAFAQSLPAPDLHNMLQRLEPISDIIPHKFPGSLRRHYEGLKRFPEGYLVLGDAICSFNPVYGQGMTSAAMQAAALDQLLTGRPALTGLWRDFFKAAAKVVEIPWQLAVGEDFRYPETEGKKPAGVDLINAYVAKVHQATHHDPMVYTAFLKVMNLMAAPTSLFHPQILWRVLWGNRRNQATATMPQPEMAYSGD